MNRTRVPFSITATAVMLVMAVGALVAMLPTAALAHVHPVPGKVVAGRATTVEFGFEHGCGESATTGVELVVPKSVTKAVLKGPTGWTAASAPRGHLAVAGAAIAHDTEFAVSISFKAPVKQQSLTWKIVQRCDKGMLRWIGKVKKGAPEPDYPAPVVKVVSKADANKPSAPRHH